MAFVTNYNKGENTQIILCDTHKAPCNAIMILFFNTLM